MPSNISTILFALAGGILPAIFWLWFWLREDSKRPEPKRLIIRTFILGMVAVLLVLPFQRYVDHIFPGYTLTTFLVWAFLEELFKFLAAYFGGLKNKEDNEPLDPMIYMITAAVGFIALENTLFIINPLLQQDLTGGIITGNFRFIGASLLHILSSSMIGIGIALSFYKSKEIQVEDLMIGFCLATITHTIFNLFILNQPGFGVFKTFSVLWIGIAILMLVFERIKRIKPTIQNIPSQNFSNDLKMLE